MISTPEPGALGGHSQVCRANPNPSGLTTLGQCRLGSPNITEETLPEESSLLNSHLSWEQSRCCLPLSVLFWPGKGLLQNVVLEAGNHRVRLIWLWLMLRLVWKKSRRVQVLGSRAKSPPLPGKKKKQHSSWASDASSGFFSRRKTELCPPLAAAKVELIAALPAFQQVLINNLFIFHVILIFKCEYLPADTGRLQEPFSED